MTCDEALDRLLEAAPAELRGDADTELARHIAGCRRCAAVAGALLAETDAMDRALEELAGLGPDADAVADAALAARAAGDPDVVPITAGRVSDRRKADTGRVSWARRAWVPLATAAALAAVLVLAREERPVPAVPEPGPRLEPRVSVTPPPDRGAAIMTTQNPNITIVWLYEREGT